MQIYIGRLDYLSDFKLKRIFHFFINELSIHKQFWSRDDVFFSPLVQSCSKMLFKMLTFTVFLEKSSDYNKKVKEIKCLYLSNIHFLNSNKCQIHAYPAEFF